MAAKKKQAKKKAAKPKAKKDSPCCCANCWSLSTTTSACPTPQSRTSSTSSPDRVICLGDVVGYGPHPARCVDLARRRCEVTVCGDHDFAATAIAFGFEECARASLEWTRDRLRPGRFSPWRRARWQFLKHLPGRHHEERVLYIHGSPSSPMEGITESDIHDQGPDPSSKIHKVFSAIDRLCFAGHTHEPGIFTGDYMYLPSSALARSLYVVPKGNKTIVNVGSVGQPRDGDPRACYVTFDGEAVQFHRVEYDVEQVVADVERISELDDRLGTRLREGK